jgi:hypothetical protein
MQLRRGCAAFVALACWAATAAADPLDTARSQVAASDYLNARGSLDAAFATGTNNPEQVAEIYRLRGIVNGALGDAKAAQDAFQRCLALSPKAELPPGTSPKMARPFAAALDYFKKRQPLQIKQETASNPPSVTVTIASDPLAMIAKVEVSVKVDGAAEQKLEGTGTDKVTITLPTGSRLDLRIAAVDDKGNHLAELGSADVPIVIIGPARIGKPDELVTKPLEPKRPPKPVHERPLYWKWWLWGGGAVVFAGAATYFGIDGLLAKGDLEDLNADSPNHSFDEAKDLESRARRGFLVANIGYGVAGALAITSVILFLTEPDAPAKESRDQKRVTAIPLTGGGAIIFGGHF